MAIRQFRALRVYEHAAELRRQVFELSRRWPKEEQYALTNQIRRSSRSVGSNVAEAWSKRRHERHFISKLTDAHAEGAEASVWLDEASYLSE